MTDLGVLKWQSESEWMLQSFIIAKIDGTIPFASDFGELNNQIVWKPSLIPQISTFLQDLKEGTHAMVLDLSMG